MIMYAIGNFYSAEMYYDVATKKDTSTLGSTCLFPTEELAYQYMRSEVKGSYEVVEINVHEIEEDGTFYFTRGLVTLWDA